MKKFAKIFAILALIASPALAEISTLTDTDAVASSENSLKAFVGFEANNILLIEDGSIYFSLHGGVALNPNFRLGIYAATVASDVNTREKGKNISVDYNALGLLAELKPISFGKFSLSIPVSAGAGFSNIQTQGTENSKAKDGFFVADAALHFNYQITPALEFGIGGGYRFFLGISEDGFDNGDFNTPFGAIFINWGEN
ncbi:MAG: hypothetical protein J6Z31_08000 [Fibrobacter sp.]|nr:hypothetical protein [Fibrobacter sp.]